MTDTSRISTQRFPAHARWSIGDFVMTLLLEGVTQVSVAPEADELVVSWPTKQTPPREAFAA